MRTRSTSATHGSSEPQTSSRTSTRSASAGEIQDVVGFSVGGPDLVANKFDGVVKVADEINQRDVNFSQKFVCKDSVREGIEGEKRSSHCSKGIGSTSKRVSGFRSPWWSMGFLLLLVLRFVSVGRAEGDDGVDRESLEEVEGFEVFAGDHLQIDRSMGGFGAFCLGKGMVMVMVQCEEEEGVLLPGSAGDGVKEKVMQAPEKVMHSRPVALERVRFR